MKIYEIQPASNSTLFLIVPIVVLLLFIVLFLFYAFISSKTAKFIINDGVLEIKATLYSTKMPINDLKRNEIKIINLLEDKSWSLKWRLNGIGLIGYSEGWFRLNNKEKALAFVTNQKEVVLIPTIKDYYLLVSPKNPNEFVRELKAE